MQEKRANENRMKELEKALALSGITNAQLLPTATGFPVRNDASTLTAPMEMKMYYQMIKQVMSAIDAFKFRLERGRYSRIRNGVQRLHEEENDKFDDHLVKLLRPYFPDLIPGKPKFEKHEPKRHACSVLRCKERMKTEK
ncbi:hypothetical protein SI65_01665 [Aspergillus cristatus]|uniref:Uncharacterized protein n=1 Tax=Aspergillus cristatus TaxID=573508 RepID=A0A1E3BT17_ASPCR|nr:hypothetical protein SI65_01665 [Aspergillus cristatus]